jgi:hypothetical protein
MASLDTRATERKRRRRSRAKVAKVEKRGVSEKAGSGSGVRLGNEQSAPRLRRETPPREKNAKKMRRWVRVGIQRVPDVIRDPPETLGGGGVASGVFVRGRTYLIFDRSGGIDGEEMDAFRSRLVDEFGAEQTPALLLSQRVPDDYVGLTPRRRRRRRSLTRRHLADHVASQLPPSLKS